MVGRGIMRAGLLLGSAIRTLVHPEGMEDPAFRRAFEDESREGNARVLCWVACVLAPVRVLAVIVLLGRAEIDPARAAWLAGAVRVQALEAVLSTLAGVVAWRRRPAALWAVLGEGVVVTGLLGGASMSANAQRAHPNLNVFIIAAVSSAFFLRVRPALFAPVLLAAAGIVLAGIAYFPRDPTARIADVFSVLGVTALSLFGFLISRSMRARELRARRHVEQLNAELERRVEAQVGEIVGRAREIDQLNAQLNERIRERSRELSAALARLADGYRLLDAGAVLGGRVRVDARIGQGAMGIVYRGVDLVTSQAVAVKVLHTASPDDIDGLYRFLREAEALASVTHAAIVRSYHVDVGEDGRLFQVMELLAGETLDARLARKGPLSPGAAARLGAVLAEALAAAHAAGVVHRDVKPSNVMLTREAPGLKLLDFGISKLAYVGGSAGSADSAGSAPKPPGDAGAGAGGGRTESRIVGTPEFLAPEQVNAPSTVAAAADVYALGLVLYQCLSGRMPFEPTSVSKWLIAHLVEPPEDLARHVPDVDPALASAVMACLEKDPGARPTAAAMVTALSRAADAAGTPSLEALDLAAPGERHSTTAVTRSLPAEEATFRSKATLASADRTKP